MTTRAKPWVNLTCLGLGAIMLVFGVWAFAWPHSFFDVVGYFPPYNRHYTHDGGTLQVGVGVSLVLAALGCSARTTALGGFVAFEGLHVVSHSIDHDLGGTPIRDIPFLVVLVLAGVGALVAPARKGQ